MKTFFQVLILLLTFKCSVCFSQIVTVNGILIPDGADADANNPLELIVGGPSSDFASLTFPFPSASTCAPAPTPTTINQEIDTYGKTILLVTSPSNCPYCVNAANAANSAIMAKLPNIRLWYAASKLQGATSDCDEITTQKTAFPFLANAHFTFMEAPYWWDATLGRAHHNGSSTSYLMSPGMPSSYRVIDPVSRKVVSYGYYLDEAALTAAIANNFTPGGSLTIAPSTLNFIAAANNLNFSVTGSGNWTIAENASWLSVNSVSGSGAKTLIASATANQSTNLRTATITVTSGSINRTITVSQAAASPIFTVTPTSLVYTSGSGVTANISVTSNLSWSATGIPTWINLNTSSGINNALVIGTTATANASINIRTAAITFSAGASSTIVNITQTGAAPTLVANASNYTVLASGSTTVLGVLSNISWNIAENAAWLSTDINLGTGNANVNITVLANQTINVRTTVITLSGGSFNRLITISQPGLTPILSVNTTTSFFSASAQSNTITVLSNMTWAVSENAPWLSLNVISGANDGTFQVSALANVNVASRSDVVTVSGGGINRIITYTQAGATPALSVTPTSTSYISGGESKNFTVTSNINWTISSSSPWLSFSANTGNAGTVSFTATASANSTVMPRAGQVTVSGGALTQLINVSQNGVSAVLTVNPASISYSSATEVKSITISTNTNWVASATGTWLTLGALSGTGNANPTLTAAANLSTTARSEWLIVSVSGSVQSVAVFQAGATPTLTVDASNILKSDIGGTQIVNISSNTSWTISSSQTWLTVSSVSGTGNGSFVATLAPNLTVLQKLAQITLNYGNTSKIINVSISGANPTLSVSSNSLSVIQSNNTSNININANSDWTAASNDPWLGLSPIQGSGNSTLAIATQANPNTSVRFGTISVTSGLLKEFINVTQAGLNLALNLSTSNLTFGGIASMQTIAIASNTTWTIASSDIWITSDLQNGTGNANIQLTANVNTASIPRSGFVTVTGGGFSKIISVYQSAGAAQLSISPSSLSSLSTNSTPQAVFITSNTTWTIQNPYSWITVSTLNGIADKQIFVTFSENSSIDLRNATITITGGGLVKTLTLSQLGANSNLSVSNNNFNVSSVSGFVVTTISSNVSWTAWASPTWATVNLTAGNGTKELKISYSQNPNAGFRTAVITISGGNDSKLVSLNQNAAPAITNVTVSSFVFDPTPNMRELNIQSNGTWTITENLPWISVSQTNGADDKMVNVIASDNPTTQTRFGTITVSGIDYTKVINIIQIGAPQILSTDKAALTFSGISSSETVMITSNTNWSITGLPDWLIADPQSGSLSQNVIFSASQNSDKSVRSATITIIGQDDNITFKIFQEGNPNTTSIKSNNINEVENITLYPNPVQFGEIVQCNTSINFEIVDLLGIKRAINTSVGNINTTELQKGVFMVKFSNGAIKKLVIE